jgi:hypothetical protein
LQARVWVGPDVETRSCASARPCATATTTAR